MAAKGREGEPSDQPDGGQTSRGTIPWHQPTLHVVVANSLMAVAGASLISPALPAIRDGLSLTDPQAGLVLTVFSLPGILLAPVMGIVADRFGRRPVLIPSLAIFGLSGASIAFIQSFEVLLVLRFVQGCAASGLITLSLTLVGDVFEGTRRNAVMGVNAAAMTIGVAIYPVVGGYLADIQWNLPFLVYGLSAVVGVFAFFTLEEPEVEGSAFGIRYLQQATDRVVTRTGFALYGVVFLLFLLYFGVVNTAVPFLLNETYNLPAFSIGIILAVPLFVGSVVALGNGHFARYFSSQQLMTLGFAGYGIGIAGIWFTSSGVTVALTLAILGIGHGFIIPSADAAISSLAPARLRGGVMSLRLSVKKIGQTIGPYLFASLGAMAGYPSVLAIVGAVTFVGSIVILITIMQSRPTTNPI